MGVLMSAYGDDLPLMAQLGLRGYGESRDWVTLGTVTTRGAEPEGEFGPRPATQVTVQVCCLPARFWRFTIVRPRDEAETVDGVTRGIYEPLERFVMSTGSGSLSDFWPTVESIAGHMIDIERVS